MIALCSFGIRNAASAYRHTRRKPSLSIHREDLSNAELKFKSHSQQGPRHWIGPYRNRTGGGVRLRRNTGLQGPPRRGRDHGSRELQPRHDHDRRGHRGHRLHRAADRRGAGANHRPGETGRRASHARRTDRPESGRRTGGCGHPGAIRCPSSGHAARNHQERGRPRTVQAPSRGDRRAGAAVRHRRIHGRRLRRAG